MTKAKMALMKIAGRRLFLGALALSFCGSAAEAALTRLVVEQQKPMAGGAQMLAGHFFGELDPASLHNAIITDLKLAPRNARGRVEYSATFAMTVPAKLSGLLIYDISNRGGGAPTAFPDGHINVISGWQGDIADPKLQTIAVPVARNPDGTAITGKVFARYFDMPVGTTTLSLKSGTPGRERAHIFLPVSEDGARLVKMASDDGPQLEVPRSDWAFADCATMPFPGTPDLTKLCVKGGFDPKFAYTLSFTSKDPNVMGVGPAATRDLVTFLRYGDKDDSGTPNPVAGQVRWAIMRGVSQAGNQLRSFLNLGFNQAESGKIVFDGMQSIIAARQNPINLRFALPGGSTDLYELGSEGAVWWSDYDDRARGLGTTSLLTRCRTSGICPKIVEEMGSSEFYDLRASPDYVGTDARTDIPLPANVRRYYNPGVTHGGGRGGFELGTTPQNGCVLPANPNPASDTVRAMFQALIQWVTQGVEPPPSRAPTLAAGDLVEPNAKAMGFPAIPGGLLPDTHFNALIQYDLGPGFNYADLSGVADNAPPRIVRTLPSRVPRVDADGNELAGVRSVQMQVPLGTYVGWNETASGYYAGHSCGLPGGYMPFAVTRAERLAKGDPRLSLEERYGTHDNFVARVKAAAEKLVAERFLLPDDAARIVKQAQDSKVLQP